MTKLATAREPTLWRAAATQAKEGTKNENGIPGDALLARCNDGPVERNGGSYGQPVAEGAALSRRGPADGGVLIAAVWETKNRFDRFLRDRVMPSMPIDGGLTGQPEQRAAEIANLVTA